MFSLSYLHLPFVNYWYRKIFRELPATFIFFRGWNVRGWKARGILHFSLAALLPHPIFLRGVCYSFSSDDGEMEKYAKESARCCWANCMSSMQNVFFFFSLQQGFWTSDFYFCSSHRTCNRSFFLWKGRRFPLRDSFSRFSCKKHLKKYNVEIFPPTL